MKTSLHLIFNEFSGLNGLLDCCKVHDNPVTADDVAESVIKVGDEDIFTPWDTNYVEKLHGSLLIIISNVIFLCLSFKITIYVLFIINKEEATNDPGMKNNPSIEPHRNESTANKQEHHYSVVSWRRGPYEARNSRIATRIVNDAEPI